MARQALNRGTEANDGTGDTLRTAAKKIEDNFLEIYLKLGDSDNLLSNIDFTDEGLDFLGTGSNKISLVNATPSGQKTVTIPNYTGEVVVDSASQTLLNKTITSPTIVTPKFADSDDATNTFDLVVTGTISKDTNINIPALSDSDTFIFADETQTLTNKTLTSPTVYRPIIQGDILDSSSNELIKFTSNASAITYVEIQNQATSSPVAETIVKGAGATNTNLNLQGNGSGGVNIGSRLVLETQQLNAAGTIDADKPITMISIAGTASHTLESGITSQYGEVKKIINHGAGTQTINQSSSNLAGYSNFTMAQNAAVELVWLTSQWFVVSTQGTVTLNA
jgi:hypothetical protein